MKDNSTFQNKPGGLKIQTPAEQLGISQKYVMSCATTRPQMRNFKALLVLRDLTTQDFFHTFFKLVMDQDERIISLIEEAYVMKKNKELSRITHPDKENIYELIKEYSPIDSGGDGQEEYDDSEWGPTTGKQRKRVNRELCSRDSKE
jgi:hypothetical protein